MKLKPRYLLILAPLFFASRPSAQADAISENRPAPELVGNQWFNTPGGAPISLASRKGKVTIVEFWTFGCSNCRANLGSYAKWARDWKAQGVAVIGVHTPELDNERDPKNVAVMVKRLGIQYPVLLDSNGSNWDNYRTQYWPTIYVVDKNGVIRAKWEGELEYGGAGGTVRINAVVKKLLNQ